MKAEDMIYGIQQSNGDDIAWFADEDVRNECLLTIEDLYPERHYAPVDNECCD
jgi:hypothetical protein